MSKELLKIIKNKVNFIYKDLKIDKEKLSKDLYNLVIETKKKQKLNIDKSNLNHKDTFLITYGDSFYEKKEKTFKTFEKFSLKYLENIKNIHFLPMFPFSSDDGFSVIDFYSINKKLGDWKDVKKISSNGFNLMYDCVANHMSQESEWFKSYIKKEGKFKDFFIEADIKKDYSYVTRPRTSPLIHEYKLGKHTRTAWSTFSKDQVDLNYKNPEVLIESVKILFFYFLNGAKYIRLDAIGFIWKEEKHPSIHHERAHEIIKLWRLLTDAAFKNRYLISETNVPHKENVSYFGKGDEVSLVYNFALPPLVLHTFLSNDSTKLTNWAKTISKDIFKNTTYFNFLSSHDGIGMRPIEGILNDKDKKLIVDSITKKGGLISYKNNSDGTKSIYELNIVYFDALTKKEESQDLQINKFISAINILITFLGVPAIYVHSLLGSRNWHQGVKISKINRRINRQPLDYQKIDKELQNNNSERFKVFTRINNLIKIKSKHEAFNPYGKQKVLDIDKNLFVIEREYKKSKILIITNISDKEININNKNIIKGTDILTGHKIENKLNLKPYGFVWLEKE